MDEKYLAERYTGHNIIGQIHVGQKYFGQTNIGQNDFGRRVVFPHKGNTPSMEQFKRRKIPSLTSKDSSYLWSGWRFSVAGPSRAPTSYFFYLLGSCMKYRPIPLHTNVLVWPVSTYAYCISNWVDNISCRGFTC